ncbi:MAG TPA: TonB family protein [Opitutaceae bacterium]|nr:TonB family protein [Opitutaceae bacterium]
MKTKLPLILLAAALFQPAVSQAQTADVPKVLSDNYRVTHYVEPIFPLSLANKNVGEGFAQIQILIAADGTLLETFVSEFTREEFAESAERAVRAWRFRPAENPASLPKRFNIRFDFRREGMLIVQGDFQETVNNFLNIRDDRTVTICKLRELDATPEVVNLVVPVYPAGLQQQRTDGYATVSFFIDETGMVHVASCADSSHPEFASAAVEAVKQWTFTPPLRKGGATRVFAVQDFTFTPGKAVANGAATH